MLHPLTVPINSTRNAIAKSAGRLLFRRGTPKKSIAKTAPTPPKKRLTPRGNTEFEAVWDWVVMVSVEVATRVGSDGSVSVAGDNEQPRVVEEVTQVNETEPVSR